MTQTSIQAFRKVKDHVKGQHFEIWWMLRCNPGLSDREISYKLDIEKNVVNARRNELKKMRAIYEHGLKKDPFTNMTVMTWAAYEEFPEKEEQMSLGV